MNFIKYILLITIAFNFSQSLYAADKKENWVVSCKNNENGKEFCGMVQVHSDPSTGATLMKIQINKLLSNEKKSTGISIVLPLGIFLPSGIGLKVDDGKVTIHPIQTCTKVGCLSGFLVDEKQIKEMKAGKKLSIYFSDMAHKNFHVDASLVGFTKSYNRL